MRTLTEFYGTFARPDASGDRMGVVRPLSVALADFPYDGGDPDQAYGQPGAGHGRGDGGAGASHRGLTPLMVGWEGGPDDPVDPDVFESSGPVVREEDGPQGAYLFQGMPIVVENPAGSVRAWGDPNDGSAGETHMQFDYGYIFGFDGADGEGVDVYIGPDETAEFAFVVHQMRAPHFLEYDEDKVMLGFYDENTARQAYLAHYDDERFYGGMSSMPVDDFKRRLLSGDTSKITNEAMGTPMFLAKAYQGAQIGGATGTPGAAGGWSNRPMKPWDDEEEDERRTWMTGEGMVRTGTSFTPDFRDPGDDDPPSVGLVSPDDRSTDAVLNLPLSFGQGYGGLLRPSRGRMGLIPKESAWLELERLLGKS